SRDERTLSLHLAAASSVLLTRLNRFQRDSRCTTRTIGWSYATARMASFSILDWGCQCRAPRTKRWSAMLLHWVWWRTQKDGPKSGSPRGWRDTDNQVSLMCSGDLMGTGFTSTSARPQKAGPLLFTPTSRRSNRPRRKSVWPTANWNRPTT